WKNKSEVYHINYGKLSDGSTLYSFTNISDYEETKQLLYNLLVLLFVVTVILIVGAAYYIAIKPVRAYEEMLDQHKAFIQNASHELKTPIASMSLGVDYINAADGSKLSEKSQNALTKMKKEIYYAQSLIIKTLNIEESKKQIENINISKIIDDIIEQQYNLQGVHIQKNYKPSLLHKIDSVIFTQMVTILVDNAIKHNDQSVQVEVSAWKSKEDLTIVVQDNGIGIQREQVEKIFNRHYKVNKASDGSGIGLDILKNLVSEVNGTLEVQSEPNNKTRFILNL
ncbi:HAMP domain-containing sensor histidine kinase, partial [Mammaliicoccus fleurettii]|nr:HAMP domain-containing sensor histidine kinase [Mammaliicoccus fleurettii]